MTLTRLPETRSAAAHSLQAVDSCIAASLTGPVFERVDAVLRGLPEYIGFRSGQHTRAEFSAFLEVMRQRLISRSVPPNDVHFAKRYPRSTVAAIESALALLAPLKLELPGHFYETADAVATAIAAGFDHEDFATYIYPEEGQILLAATVAFRPRRTVFLGSYYGYWAAWALPAIAACGGKAVLLDPDAQVCALARRNLQRLYPQADVEVISRTGEDYLGNDDSGSFDMVVLDAELPRAHPDPSRRGKGVYAHLLRAVLPRLAPRSLLVCHNILLRDHSACTFFDEVINRNQEELGLFLDLVRSEYGNFVELPTTEGVGIGLRE